MNADTESKREYWQRHLNRQQDSGLSQRVYCRNEGLSLSQFSYWNRKSWQGRGRQESTRLTQVPVELAGASKTAIEIEVPGSYLVRVPGDVSHQQLREVLKALESLR